MPEAVSAEAVNANLFAFGLENLPPNRPRIAETDCSAGRTQAHRF